MGALATVRVTQGGSGVFDKRIGVDYWYNQRTLICAYFLSLIGARPPPKKHHARAPFRREPDTLPHPRSKKSLLGFVRSRHSMALATFTLTPEALG